MASRILAAHQLNYLLWLGYLYKAGQADVFVLADDVQHKARVSIATECAPWTAGSG